MTKWIKKGALVIAVQLALDTEGFRYVKWGGTQKCKPFDWVVNNGGEVYTVDRETFERTYQEVSPGRFRKVTPVWAEQAVRDGVVPTKEGETAYKAGDYLVSNEEGGGDWYAVERQKFLSMYEEVK